MKLKQLLNILQIASGKVKSAEPMIVGGVPRDKYLKRLDRISDIDITTGSKDISSLSEAFAILLNKKYNITKKTMEDGHSSIFIGNIKMDFSSNFILPNIDNILSMKLTNMQRELFSRDFTCNSLLLSLDLKYLTDPLNKGFIDINSKKIKTCLSPEITLTSNKNRVIRSVYLAAKLDFDIDKSIVDYVSSNPQSVKISSNKSLVEKTNEAFKYDPDKTNYFLTKMNLWNYIPVTEKIYPYYIKYVKKSVLSV
jgi:tRNA nucleotidyltransferase/poly(A) polymerase